VTASLEKLHFAIMRELKPAVILFVALLVIFSGAGVYAQQSELTEKELLILEFRDLTGAQKVEVSVNYSIEGVKGVLARIVEDDEELNEGQKEELRKAVGESSARIEKLARDFFANESAIAKISEKAIFEVYDKTFSETELKELIVFFRTPTGRKASKFLPSVGDQVGKVVQEEMMARLKELIEPRFQIETGKLEQSVKEAKAEKP
jgi:hypothetical protein